MASNLTTVDSTAVFCRGDGTYPYTTTASVNSTEMGPSPAINTVLISALTSLLSLLIVVGNGLIIASVTIVKKLRQPANYLIVSLALSDFLVGFIVLPLTIVYDILGEWVFGSMICDVHVCFDVVCCTASIMNLCMISIDRYLMITQPMVYPKRRTGKLMAILIATAWIISCLIIIPALFGSTQNVKDAPGWLQLTPGAIISNAGEHGRGPKNSNGTFWNTSHTNTAAMIDSNISTFWKPGTSMQSENWHFTLDFGQTYKVTKVKLQSAGDRLHDVGRYDIEINLCSNGERWQIEDILEIKPGVQRAQESVLHKAIETRYFRIRINETSASEPPWIREFGVFADKLHGKTCLISQEVWFTIYSTVGAFYLPLTIMLCMYWKIYREASRFNNRKRTKSSSHCDSPIKPVGINDGSQTKNCGFTPPESPNTASMKRNNNLSRFFVNNHKTLNNNCANSFNISKMKRKQTAKCCVEFHEHPLQNGNRPSERIIRSATEDSFNGQSVPSAYDADTLYTECEFLVNDRTGETDKTDSDSCEIISNHIDIAQDTNGNGKIIDFQQRNGLKPYTNLSPNRMKVNFSFSGLHPNSASSEINNESNYDIRPRTCSDNEVLRSIVHKNSNFSRSPLASYSKSISKLLTNGEYYIPTISENNILKLTEENASGKKHNSTQEKAISFDNCTEGRRKVPDIRPSFTRSTTDTHENEESVWSCKDCKKSVWPSLENYRELPLYRTKSSSPRSRSISEHSNACNGRPCSDNRKTSFAATTARLVSDSSSNYNSGRRATVFNQIKRRVSMVASRDRMRNVKATRTLGIIVGAFTFCWLPFFIVTFLRPFVCENPESQDCIPLWLVRLVLWLGYLNSALNPLIYIGFSPDLRETFRFLLSCKCTNVDRRLAQNELRQAILEERRMSTASRALIENESIL